MKRIFPTAIADGLFQPAGFGIIFRMNSDDGVGIKPAVEGRFHGRVLAHERAEAAHIEPGSDRDRGYVVNQDGTVERVVDVPAIETMWDQRQTLGGNTGFNRGRRHSKGAPTGVAKQVYGTTYARKRKEKFKIMNPPVSSPRAKSKTKRSRKKQSKKTKRIHKKNPLTPRMPENRPFADAFIKTNG